MSDTLAWCPPKGSPNPHPSGRLRVATWNLGNLHRTDGESIFADSVQRDAVDYERIWCYIRLFDPDILAVQEVDGEAALSRVVDTDVYDLHVSTRGSPSPGMQRDDPHDERASEKRLLLQQQLGRGLHDPGHLGSHSRGLDR